MKNPGNNPEDKRAFESAIRKIEAKGRNFNMNTLTEDERSAMVKSLRSQSRASYIDERTVKQIDVFRRRIEEEEKLFTGLTLSKRELDLKDLNKRILEVAKKNKPEVANVVTYKMPIDYEEQTVNKDDLLKKALNIDHITSRETQAPKNEEQTWMENQINKMSKKTEETVDPDDFVFTKSSINDRYVHNDDEYNILEGDYQMENPKEYLDQLKTTQIQSERQKLPIWVYRDHLIDTISNNPITILVGETGSGKTTQLPQYLDEAGFTSEGLIAVTQPRRVAAMSVSARVADETETKLGHHVGYSVRFEENTSELTKIKFLTDGMLLREIMKDPELLKYKVVVIDEAHERTIHTDILFALLKDLVKSRPSFRLVIASATLEAEKFSSYFENAPVITVPGRRYPVDIFYTKAPEADYIEAAVITILQIHITQEKGDILAFLPGQEDIDMARDMLIKRAQVLGKKHAQLIILPLYSNLPSDEQMKVFERTPSDARKVVLATNIAETSVTIDGIVYVMDCGFAKQTSYNPRTGVESLVIAPISKASADQRAGRAGRVCPGKCFRLYTLWSFKYDLEDINVPEIQRSNLGSTILTLKNMGIDNIVTFDFMDAPNHEILVQALESLYQLNALSDEGDLTELGKKMCEFPLSPPYAKMVVESESFKCVDQIITICAMLNVGNSVFYRPKDKQLFADKAHRTFEKANSDHLSLLNIYNSWVDDNYTEGFARDYYLQIKSLRKARDIKEQLTLVSKRVGIDVDDPELSIYADHEGTNIKRCIAAAFFTNTAQHIKKGLFKVFKSNFSVSIHPSSYVFKKDPDTVVYDQIVMTSKEFMRNVTVIDKNWLPELAPRYFTHKDFDETHRTPNLKKLLTN